jgi:PBP1b-binding outer membrane lipoprotein LpoB
MGAGLEKLKVAGLVAGAALFLAACGGSKPAEEAAPAETEMMTEDAAAADMAPMDAAPADPMAAPADPMADPMAPAADSAAAPEAAPAQ